MNISSVEGFKGLTLLTPFSGTCLITYRISLIKQV